MQLRLLFSKWTQVAAILLMGGALAWTIKLSVIVATNGEIITTGAAALFMRIGLVLLLIGSTGIGTRVGANQNIFLRTVAVILSPALLFALCVVLNMIANPLVKESSLWYAQQEAPIAVAVVVNLILGLLLYKTYKPVTR